MDLETWIGLAPGERERRCAQIAAAIGATDVSIAARPLPSAIFEVRGREMIYVPGGSVTLGWRDDGSLEGVSSHARTLLGPPRTARLAPFLLDRFATHAEDVFDPYAVDDPEGELAAHVTRAGFRLPTGDEWEHAMRAGATTLFRWGDAIPDGGPRDAGAFRAHRAPSSLGFEVLSSTYDVEIVADRDHVRGGGGGEALCGGEPGPLPWISLALAYRHPRERWGDVVSELFETAYFRRALDLPRAGAS